MKQTRGKQKVARSAMPVREQEMGAGTEGVELAPPASGVSAVDSQPVQRMVASEPENRTGLPDRLKAGVEQLSGLAMDDVRVHYNSAKPAQLQALAYTQGTEIHVGPGQERHLSYEAWHVVQQKRERVPATLHTKGISINDDRNLEHEAQVMGTRALHVKYSDSGKSRAAIQPVTTVQRVVKAGLPNKRKIEMNPFTNIPDTSPSPIHPGTVPTPFPDIGQLRMDVTTTNRVPYTTANIEQIRRHSLPKSGAATKVRIVGYNV